MEVLRIEAATHTRDIWAKLGCMRWERMLLEGFAYSAIAVNARSVLGPHSLACGVYIVLWQFTQFVFCGKKAGSVSCFCGRAIKIVRIEECN